MEEKVKEQIYTELKEEKPAFEPLKARAYHINQAAVDICNNIRLAPSEAIVEQNSKIGEMYQLLDERDKMIASLKNIVPTDGRPVYTLQEFGDIMRKVCQTEGVMLHSDQKGFFREIFASLTKCIADKGLMRE